MLRVPAIVSVTFLLLSAPLSGIATAGDDAAKAKTIRIGTYDNRAVAIAYASSRFNPVKEKKADFDKAKAANDRAKMKELEAWGEQLQRQLHFQGFGRVPVDDLLAPVRDEVARIGRERQLAAIAMSCDFHAAGVELVDITDDLVKLYNPSDKALEHIRQIRQAKPIPLTQLGNSARH